MFPRSGDAGLRLELETKLREVFTVPGEGPCPTKALSLRKAPYSAFTIKTLC